jgi:hypothetical protein
MLKYTVLCSLIIWLGAQPNALSHAFQAQAIHSIYVTHQAISAELSLFSKGYSSLEAFDQSLENYQAMSLNLALTLDHELTQGYKESDSLFIQTMSKTQRKLAAMAESYRDFLYSKDPLSALEYNRLHREVWLVIQQVMYLKDHDE